MPEVTDLKSTKRNLTRIFTVLLTQQILYLKVQKSFIATFIKRISIHPTGSVSDSKLLLAPHIWTLIFLLMLFGKIPVCQIKGFGVWGYFV